MLDITTLTREWLGSKRAVKSQATDGKQCVCKITSKCIFSTNKLTSLLIINLVDIEHLVEALEKEVVKHWLRSFSIPAVFNRDEWQVTDPLLVVHEAVVHPVPRSTFPFTLPWGWNLT